MDIFEPYVVVTLTSLGKSIGFGFVIGVAAFGTALGVGLIGVPARPVVIRMNLVLGCEKFLGFFLAFSL